MYYIGVDIGGTNVKAGIVSEAGEILAKDMIPTNAGRHYTEVIKDIAGLVKKLISDLGIAQEEIRSIGIGNPGTCDTQEGVVICASNIGFENVPITEEMGKYFDLPIFIGNDANCAAWGEYTALDAPADNIVFITLGTGVGGGIIIDRKLYTGTNGTAAEVGHTSIVQGGLPCSCGARGCWEMYASVNALIRMTREYAQSHPNSEAARVCAQHISGKTAFELAKRGDAGGKEIVEQWIGYVAAGIINIINLLQPEILIIGGAISKEGDFLLKPIIEMQKANKYSQIPGRTKIVTARLGNDAGLIGSAFLGATNPMNRS